MTYSIHGCSAVHHHPSATATTTVAVFSGDNCSIMNSTNTVSLKRKSLSDQSSPKRVTLNSPPASSSTTTTADAAIAAAEGGLTAISPITSPSPAFSPSPKRVSEKSLSPTTTTTTAATISAGEDGPAFISPSPAFSPFSKRVSEKSPFSTTNTAAAITTNATAAPPLPFSRFTKTQPSNNNKNLRRTLSEPPIFDSFTDFCRYMNSQSPENGKNNSSISVRRPLHRSISDPTDILVPAAVKPPPFASKTEHEQSKRIKEFLNDKEEATVPENNEEKNSNNSEKS